MVRSAGLALRDNLKIGNDFPLQRQCDSFVKLGPRGLPRPHHDRPIQKPVRGPDRQGVKDDLAAPPRPSRAGDPDHR